MSFTKSSSRCQNAARPPMCNPGGWAFYSARPSVCSENSRLIFIFHRKHVKFFTQNAFDFIIDNFFMRHIRIEAARIKPSGMAGCILI
jgi:hypothetical protein